MHSGSDTRESWELVSLREAASRALGKVAQDAEIAPGGAAYEQVRVRFESNQAMQAQ